MKKKNVCLLPDPLNNKITKLAQYMMIAGLKLTVGCFYHDRFAMYIFQLNSDVK